MTWLRDNNTHYNGDKMDIKEHLKHMARGERRKVVGAGTIVEERVVRSVETKK